MKTVAALAPALGTASPSEERSPSGRITEVAGLRVGHFTDKRRPTGCTVILFDNGAVAGVDVRGSAPGTRETDLLQPTNTVQKVNAILLSGGSAFGLSAAGGVMRFLAEHGQGFPAGHTVVPIVPAAILFDLELGDPKIFPDEQSGYVACQAASNGAVEEGCVGAGAGATVGKLFGSGSAMKSGLGTASITIRGTDISVGALVAVNAVGDVRDHRTGIILAGARDRNGGFLDSMSQVIGGASVKARVGTNTTVGIVATNASLTKTEATKIAQMAHDGLARTINPVHTAYDGDTLFAAGTGLAKDRADVSTLGAVGAEVMAEAVNRAVLTATTIPGYPARRDLK
ncbi:MAG: P1 family peptidase [Acidobacteriaceae bacterium]|nr:P1 family peptidase [Acidobacteriaceae bacterium]